ncbi:unnamed protein product [Adineta steineri]|uniref:Golgi apparatus protein 1 n=3 Tax=Adineta steineri TaxID=433720 RepID=A0A815NKC9_9BILA|nr:unnamed protein product [Adineta steineri]
MFFRQLIIISLFIIIFIQQLQSIEKDVDEDKFDEPKQSRQIGKKQKLLEPSESAAKVSVDKDVDEDKVDEPKQSPRIGKKQKLLELSDTAAKVPVKETSTSSNKSSVSTTLADSDECEADIKRYCNKGRSKPISNINVLDCINDLDNAVNLISKECQTVIYKFKYNMTHDVRFDNAANSFCAKDIKLLEECHKEKEDKGTGHLVSCLYDRLPNITETQCRNFINRVQSVVFTDWRLSEAFATACLTDITNLKCGRLNDVNDTLPHDQGAVISCLSKSFKTLSPACNKHVTRLTEMQSDDFHLDRALFIACRDDRQRLCPRVASGNGRVYRCLYEQKFNSLMSKACRQEVHRRQGVVVSNVRSDAPLLRVCRTEMTEHKCVVSSEDPNQQLTLINLLLCLEDRIKKGNQINDECRREMLVHRRMLMSDYALSPEIIAKCEPEMNQHCAPLYRKNATGTIDQRGGRMIHCLSKAARTEKSFSPACLGAIKSLIRAVDPGSDIRADPLLETTCRPVIDAVCQKIKPGDSNIVMCLLNNLKHIRMTEDCEDRLMEITYFIARDWRLTPKLIRTCQANLVSLCQLPPNWSMTNTTSDTTIGTYLGCLYQQKSKLDKECGTELKRLMSMRSKSIGLMPEIEDNCIEDLATCANPDVKGEEMKCLQKKYDKLEPQCKTAVQTYTKMVMSDPSLDSLLMKACEPMVDLFCSSIDGGKENDLLRCLIKHKNDNKMTINCKAGIEHHQILSLKDKAFLSDQFTRKCSKEITEHCAEKKTKASIIQCVADLILRDVIQKRKTINDECREELKFEFLQRSENIQLDPLLATACKADIVRLCASKTAGNAQVLDCLKANHDKVSRTCYARLKKREKLDVVLPTNDFSLTTKCSSVIQKFCSNEKKQNMLLCLRRNANHESVSPICRNVLYHRLMVLNSDARFHKDLITNCHRDVTKFCSNVIITDDDLADESNDDNDKNKEESDEVQDRDMGGRVIECLRSKYADTKNDLEPQCVTEIIDVVQASKLDIQLDVQLYQKCKKTLASFCVGSDQEDCLKLLFQQKKLTDVECKKQVLRIIKEGRADVHVDPGLLITCQADILKYCNDVPIGSGKQLQCLLRTKKPVSKSCKDMLSKRQELWSSISDVDNIGDLTKHIINSKNNVYLYGILFIILSVIFLTGCVSRPCIRYRRVSKYNT